MGDFHEGDMALELAEREFYSISPVELLRIAEEERGRAVRFAEVVRLVRDRVDKKWLEKATEDPEAVRREYEMTIGLDGFPGTEVEGVQ